MVFHLGNHPRHLQRILMSLVLDTGRKSRQHPVDIIFRQRHLQLEPAHHLHLPHTAAGTHLLSLGHTHIAELSCHWRTHYQLPRAPHHPLEFLIRLLPVGGYHLPLEASGDGVVAQVLHLQEHLLPLVLIILFRHLQLRLALDAHAVFLPALLERFLQARHLVLGIEGLLLEVDGLLRHLYLLLTVVAPVVAPGVALIVDGVVELGVGEYQDCVALTKHRSFLCHHSLHEATLHGVHLNGLYRLHQSLNIYILHEGSFLYLGYHQIVSAHFLATDSG